NNHLIQKFVWDAPLVANFTAKNTSGIAPLTVRFTGTSTGLPKSWNWSFGDGSFVNATEQNPVHTYINIGTYTVSLTVSNTTGSNTLTVTNYITVTKSPLAPLANFTGTPTSGTAPLTVQFTDLSTNTPTRWIWNFGDGDYSVLQNPSHTYREIRTYNVSLNAINDYGDNKFSRNNYISVNTPKSTLWNMTMNVASGTYNQNVIMGSAISATRGYDAGLDVAMPPDPPGTKKIVYFSISDPLFDHLSTDYKPLVNETNTVEYWTLFIKSNDTVRVLWDATLIGNPNLTFMWNDGTTTVNMRSVTNMTLPAGEYYVNLSASMSATMDLPLNGGWNLVSVPFTHAQYVVPANSIQTIYSYNPLTRGYEGPVQISSLEPGKAYWIASTRDCIVNVTGEPTHPIVKSLTAGWNLVGGSDNIVPFNSIIIDPSGSWGASFVYGYNAQSRLYEQATNLQSGRGYWGAVSRDCVITVP
ncbi:MAG: PKD domain-containing protein, partial [Methanoregula sp.]